MVKSKLIRMDNVAIVVESLDETIAFFVELGMKLEGRATPPLLSATRYIDNGTPLSTAS